MLKGFRDFILQGNVVELATAVIIGGAFTAIVTAFSDKIINPLIAAIFGKPDISGVGHFVINDANFSVGLFLNAVLNFLIIAAALYFVVVAPLNHLAELRARGRVEEPEPPAEDIALLQEIRDLLAAQRSGGTPGEDPESSRPGL